MKPVRWAAIAVVLALVVAALACGSVASSSDAKTTDSPSGHVCVFGTDAYDNGCAFGP